MRAYRSGAGEDVPHEPEAQATILAATGAREISEAKFTQDSPLARQWRIIAGMESELLLIAMAFLLLVGCGARGGSSETKASPEMPRIPVAERALPEVPQPAYGLPLDIHIDVPEAPREIRGPSAPIPEGTAMPGGIFSACGENKK